MKHDEQDRIEHDDHALLAASVFGELSADEQAALDARLANEPELRAERDAIAATASLVRGAFPAGESLPPKLMASLERAASAGVVTPLAAVNQRTQWFRIAAGLTLLCGGAIAANEWFQRGKAEDTREDRLAQSDADFAYGQRDKAGEKSEFLPVTKVNTEGATKLARELYFDPEDPEDPEEYAEIREQLDEVAKKMDSRSSAQGEGVLYDLGLIESRRAGETDGSVAGRSGVPQTRSQGAYGVLDSAQPEAETASDDAFFIGHGQPASGDRAGERGSALAPATVEPLDRPGTSRGDAYHGPGDSTPSEDAKERPAVGGVLVVTGPSAPATGAGGAQPGAPSSKGGPSSPGPAGLSGPAPAREVKRVKSGAPTSVPAESPSVNDALPGLGYLGDADDGEEADSGRFRRVVRLEDGEVQYGSDYDVELKLKDRKRDFAGRLVYTEAELDAIAAARCERVLVSCRPLPDERPNMMFFRFYGDNGFELAHIDPLSTFGADVDTASYTLARRYLRDGLLPEKAQIRTEEFVNYFKPDLAPPPADSKVPFAVHTELGISRYGRDQWASERSEGADRWMLRVGVRGKEVAREDRQPLQLTFVVDTSGSMKEGGRMELVKHALRLLITELDANDSIALVAFSNEARQILPMTSAANRGLIETSIHGLSPNGGTNAEAGLRMGYETAGLTLAPGNHSRVVLLSDGVANIGQTDQDRVNEDVRKQRERGIYLNTVGVGMGNHNDTFLEQLANKGDGLCNYVDDEREARRALVENFTGAFETIARDLKVQVEFDPSQVYRYRLLGYENRAIADADFRNDKVDAGEVGAGHQVVALYELELTGNASEAPLAKVNVRWKAPTGAGRHPSEDVAAGELAYPVSAASRTAFESTSLGFQRDACVAQFAEILRRSVHARGDSLDDLIAQSAKLDAQLRDPDFSEFVDMLRASRRLIIERAPRTSDLTDCIDALRRNRILRAQVEELRRDQSATLLSDLEQQNAQLELRIRDLIRQELEQELK